MIREVDIDDRKAGVDGPFTIPIEGVILSRVSHTSSRAFDHSLPYHLSISQTLDFRILASLMMIPLRPLESLPNNCAVLHETYGSWKMTSKGTASA